MSLSRRQFVGWGGGLAAALCLRPVLASADEAVEIVMTGTKDGSRVWFDPLGIHIKPGQTVRWINKDPGNAHTATAYHPANFDHPLRIPAGAEPWGSDYLLPDEAFSFSFTAEGVYDFFCVPHEHAGMVGRLIVGSPSPRGWDDGAAAERGVPPAALAAFPAIDRIMKTGVVRRA